MVTVQKPLCRDYEDLMTAIFVKAPGKLFLLGEYAVLFDSPAVVMAVDRYATVAVEPSQDQFQVQFAGTGMPGLTGQWQNGMIDWGATDPVHKLFVTITDTLSDAGMVTSRSAPFSMGIDSSELCDEEQKLGLGSSAAVTNAVVRAVLEFYSRDFDDASLAKLVFGAHSRFQNRQGSGADVAAGIAGGVFVYQQGRGSAMPQYHCVPLPEDLAMTMVWAGKPASTTQALETMNSFRNAHAAEFAHALAPLRTCAQRGVAALEQGWGEVFGRCCASYCHYLSDFGRIVGLDVMSEAHEKCLSLAESRGLPYKPSGAGVGDFGVVFANDISDLECFEKDARAAGFRIERFQPGQKCHRIDV